MASYKALCLAGVASLAVAASAHAADLLPSLPPVEAPYIPPQPLIGGGWYLRGDVGAGALQLRDKSSSFSPDFAYLDNNGNATGNGQPLGFADQSSDLREQLLAGVGVGYQFNRYFRADVTGEYRFASNFHSIETYSNVNNQFENYNGGADFYRGNVSSGLFLINGYAELGTWSHLTPYVGAGVGVAINTVGGITDYNLSDNGVASGSSSSNTRSSFAYAFMAGVAYDVAPNLKLDFGYRFVDLGRATSGVINCYGGSSDCGNNSREVQSFRLYSNDIRLGLRYTFADLVPQQQLPLIRKY